MKLKNVIVFTTGKTTYAIELGWIREVFTLGHVTPVPQAPSAIAGVVNFRGSIVAVVDIRKSPEESGLRTKNASACQGQSALLLEVERCQVALRVGTIDEVSSLCAASTWDHLLDSRGREAKLLHPEKLFGSLQGVL